ncbi:lipoprotein insertase outer membrane protein LolB [Gilvimarinus agarilyticus]|uniref:lipoprotein insertase outer membrane protein LolB n=1 Tax=Gilvimarinus agarilyticus TaxID=679259 RepID=UPI00069659CA|nr:lipoprotein insertase outer membrane protein LolB [Gilvimarinus agarilyticus]
MRKTQTLIALLAVLLLTRCANVPSNTGAPPEGPVDTQAHEERLRAISQWHLQAKAGLRSPEQNGSARLDWRHSPSSFDISLSGPLGQGRVELKGTPEGVVLTQPDSEPLRAESAEALLYQQTGWDLPVGLLADWLLGLPATKQPVDDLKRNDNGLLKTLSQAGWQLSYLNYQSVADVFLPGKVIATRELDNEQRIRLVIAVYDWHVTRNTP